MGGKRGTVRGRTTAAAAAVVGVAVLGGGVTLDRRLQSTLVHNVDKVAELRGEEVVALAKRGAFGGTGREGALGAGEDMFVQVVDTGDRVIAASANVDGHATYAHLVAPAEDYVAASIDGAPPLDGRFRVVAMRARSPAGPLTVYVGASLEPVEETMEVLRRSLLAGGPLLVALVAFLTWRTVGRALQPVESIRSRVAEVSSLDLGRRVPEPAANDEIGRLARTMNAMLARLESATARQRQFVADASHELQSPLAAARTDLEVALTHPQAAEWSDVARDVLAEHRRMERLVADLLFVARADEGRDVRPPAVPVDLHEVVLEEVARVFGAHRVTVDTGGVAVAVVDGRRDDLARAVRNLLDNASRHAVERVTVGLQSSGTVATLVVEDDGPGVPPEHRERIFDRFTRLDDARAHGAGTGLGLAIVRQVVEAHGGRVALAEGTAGARFVVTLPAGRG